MSTNGFKSPRLSSGLHQFPHVSHNASARFVMFSNCVHASPLNSVRFQPTLNVSTRFITAQIVFCAPHNVLTRIRVVPNNSRGFNAFPRSSTRFQAFPKDHCASPHFHTLLIVSMSLNASSVASARFSALLQDSVCSRLSTWAHERPQ